MLLNGGDMLLVLSAVEGELGMAKSPGGLCAQQCVGCLLLCWVGEVCMCDVGIGVGVDNVLELGYPVGLGLALGLVGAGRCRCGRWEGRVSHVASP